MINIPAVIVLIFLSNSMADVYAQEKVESLEQKGIQRIIKGQQAQQKITDMHASTRSMVDDYQEHLKLVDGLRLYNKMMQRQLQSQQEEMEILKSGVQDVAVMERQILPLLSGMIDGLEQFVMIDVPFLAEERRQRIGKLRALLSRSDVTVAEKTRRVMEAYQVENDYGRTIESYKDKLLLGSASFDADFLRVGRVGLMYRIVGNGEVGYWSSSDAGWQPLPKVPYRRHIDQGIKVAKQEVAPELISIPINPKQAVLR